MMLALSSEKGLVLLLLALLLPSNLQALRTSPIEQRQALEQQYQQELMWDSARALVQSARTDEFTWSKLITVGIKVMLAVLSSEDNLSKSDTISKQAVLGTVLSAVTGVNDPSEISVMAKQATQVIGLLQTLVEAVKMSVLS